jgi:hypothetical protein
MLRRYLANPSKAH